ncbi:MAG TPA: glycerol kinase GlpK [Mycobacteriales bacterium]|nr:glycerol kinase GlpK [Mycobacteriales bacterium]
MTVLAIDAGTTGVTALLISEAGRVAARGYQEFPQHFPEPGWVEHEPEEIWQATLAACRGALSAGAEPPTAIGITNQRETAVLWDRRTLAAPRRAIVWQDRRTAALCEQLRDAGHERRVAELTGLRLDPYFTGTKLAWLAANDPAWIGVTSGDVAVGTVDSYLVARLTAGQEHVTDPSNASRTLLYDIADGTWSDELCELLRVPSSALPEVRRSSGELGRTNPAAFLGLDLPIAGIAGDQQAALFGQTCFDDGESKCTYGTGSFILVNTGADPVRSDAGLLTTVAWDIGDGLVYALEGAIFVTGAAVQWLRDGLGIISTAAETEAVARSVGDSGGVVFVPALTGLGAPHWDPDARGAITGITRGTTRAHLVRATLEAIAYEVRDVVDVMVRDAGVTLPELSVDGGASANDLLCQLQATELQVPVRRPQVAETTALGAAFLAGLATGVWSSRDELRATWQLDQRFEPEPRDDAGYARWQDAIHRTRSHPQPSSK